MDELEVADLLTPDAVVAEDGIVGAFPYAVWHTGMRTGPAMDVPARCHMSLGSARGKVQ